MSEEAQAGSDNIFLATEVDSEADSAVDSEVDINNHKLDGPSLKPDVSAACQVEIPREVNDPLVTNQQLDSLKSTTTKEEHKLTLHTQWRLSSTLLMQSHTEPSSHSDHL